MMSLREKRSEFPPLRTSGVPLASWPRFPLPGFLFGERKGPPVIDGPSDELLTGITDTMEAKSNTSICI